MKTVLIGLVCMGKNPYTQPRRRSETLAWVITVAMCMTLLHVSDALDLKAEGDTF